MTDNQFDWMRESIYEPPPPIKHTWRPHIAFFFCAMAIVTGMLIAVGEWL